MFLFKIIKLNNQFNSNFFHKLKSTKVFKVKIKVNQQASKKSMKIYMLMILILKKAAKMQIKVNKIIKKISSKKNRNKKTKLMKINNNIALIKITSLIP